MVVITSLAILGAGIVTGLLFAFSNFVMTALARLPEEHGMFAMQQINEKIINPIFLLFFLGTPGLCIVLAIGALLSLQSASDYWLLSGSICYLIGPFGITLSCNVPLNNKLASHETSEANTVWIDYQTSWQRWNHIRTIIGMISIALLAMGLGI